MRTAPIVLAFALCLSPAPALAQQRRPAPRLPDAVVLERDIEYGRAGERPLKLDLLRPKEDPDRVRPVLVYIHGGGWRGGDKAHGHGFLAGLVATGHYVGVSVGYRLSAEAVFPAQIHDCKAAIRWVRRNAKAQGFDPERIAVMGHSAGGHLALLLGSSGGVKALEGECGNPGLESRVSCVVSFAGPSDFLDWGANLHPAVGLLLGGSPEERRELAAQASPVTHASADDPPFLVVHGTRDTVVPFHQAQRMEAALRRAGADVRLVTVEGAGHGVPLPPRNLQLFLARHLRRAEVERALDEALRAETAQAPR